MDNILNISKKALASKAKNFALLKDEGIQHIQTLAGTQWTDYNAHDPGITLLEVLSYAINDLANRTSFDMKDLLAEDNGPAGNQTHFFKPEEILSTNPVSIQDLRKVIIDTPGIKNAWLEPKTDPNFYSDGPAIHHNKTEGKLDYTPFKNDAPVNLIGLYDVLLEFEYHEDFGDLNSNSVKLALEITDADAPLHGFKAMLAAEFPYWDDAIFPDTDLSHLSEDQLLEFKRNLLTEHLQDVDITLYKGFDGLRFNLKNLKDIHSGNATVEVRDRISGERLSDHETELQAGISETLNALAEKYYNKVILVRQLVKTVNTRLQSHRNLCEDFTSYKSLKVKEVALCIKVDLKHDAIPDQVLAHIYHALELFLAPGLKWCNLSDLLAQGISFDEAFEGPLLDHGFLTEDQLGITDRKSMLYISDLINVISDIAGVEFLGEVEVGLKNGREFKLSDSADHWHVALSEQNQQSTYYIPRLNIDHSNIRFFKSGIPLATNRDKVNSLLTSLRAEIANKTRPSATDRFSIPEGISRNVAEYASIQEDLPMTYGIGVEGLPASESTARKASAMQLKGYLLVFEQLLTNYLAQLKHINLLFSLDTSVKQTYFVQDLSDVPGIAPLLTDFVSATNHITDPQQLKNHWAGFIGNTENAYLQHLREIAQSGKTEGSDTFIDRRNRFLDHLMARFGEQIGDYANIMHSIDTDVSGYQLIEDKALLLKDYPFISANRGKGFNYLEEDKPQSGLETRIARLLGIASEEESSANLRFESFQNNDGQFGFRIFNQSGQPILFNAQFYDTSETIEEIKKQLLDEGLDNDRYSLISAPGGKFHFEFAVAGKVLAQSPDFESELIPDQQLQQVMFCIDRLRMKDERVLLIEHLLLRPKLTGRDALLPVYQVTGDHGEAICCPGNSDPYSFITSIILPSWPARFRNLDFRRHIEECIRLETPAHIFPKICWVTPEVMQELEAALAQWKEAMAAIDFNDELFVKAFRGRSLNQLIETELQGLSLTETEISLRIDEAADQLRQQSQNSDLTPEVRRDLISKTDRLEKRKKLLIRSEAQIKLIEAMQNMRNVYPTATLYDCQDGSSENPIALNKTKLGTFKSLEDE